MIRTLIVSNRLPFRVEPDASGNLQLRNGNGGLVSAMWPVHQQSDSLWLGYAGASAIDSAWAEIYAQHHIVPLSLPDDLYDRYYNGEANGVLWPLLHYFPALTHFSIDQWDAYVEVNKRFADAVINHISDDDDVVWIHDYQLMLVPALVRERRPQVRIGYFHHIPFPAADVFKLHPAREALLRGVLAADFVGFHTLEYARHFIATCERQLGLEPQADVLIDGEHLVRVGALPLGIDFAALESARQHGDHAQFTAELTTAWGARRLIVGIERLDYTKGIRERLLAFAHMLRMRPDLREQVVFIQVCVPSREDIDRYAELRRDIEQLVSRINGEFATATHTPVMYLHRGFSWPELTALYRRADVCLVTPLRDGLNLVCKEFVAVRDDLDGVLVLSEFAGAAEEMGEALLVNPYDTAGVASALATALDMGPEERRQRMSALHERVRAFDNNTWSASFISHVTEMAALNRANASRDLDDEEAHQLAQRLQTRTHLLVAVDLDAVLMPKTGRRNSRRRWSSERLRDELAAIAHPDLVLTLLVGDDHAFVQEFLAMLGTLPVWAAESRGNGLRPPSGPWSRLSGMPDFAPFHSHIIDILNRCVVRVPQSYLIDDGNRIAWAFRHVGGPIARGIARETAHAINQILAKSSFHAVIGRNGLEIRSSDHDQGRALARVAQACGLPSGHDLITIGDRFSDDALFAWGDEHNHGIAIGAPATRARHLVPDLERLSAALRHILP